MSGLFLEVFRLLTQSYTSRCIVLEEYAVLHISRIEIGKRQQRKERYHHDIR